MTGLEAWDNKFSEGQIKDIISMISYAYRTGMDLQQELKSNPPIPISAEKRKVILDHSKLSLEKCPICGKTMQLYPVNSEGMDKVGSTDFEDKESSKYRSMWLCGKSCNGTGCGHEEYNYYSVEDYKRRIR